MTEDTNRNFARAAEANLAAAITIWAWASEGGEVEQRDGALLARCAVPMRSFNNALVTDATVDAAQLLGDVRKYFELSEGRYRLRIREGAQPTDDATFGVHGLERRGGIPSLTVSLPLIVQTDAPIEIRSVSDDATLADHTRVVAAAFDWEPSVLSRVFRCGLLEASGWQGFVGYVDGEPAGASQLVMSSGVAGIYYVGTAEPMRRRGIGEAMTRYALDVGAGFGCAVGSLQASPMGRPIYERMGFETVAQYRTYVPAV